MQDNNGKVNGIRHESERLFAENFFDHDKWVYEPRFFYFKDGSKYLPDFYDARRDAYIEVVGSRQAYAHNKAKYEKFFTEYPDIQIEFRTPSGAIVSERNGRMVLRTRNCVERLKKLKHMDGASNIQRIIDAKGISVEDAAKLCGMSESTVRSHYYGQRKTMTLPIAAKYAKGFGVEMGELFKGGDAA